MKNSENLDAKQLIEVPLSYCKGASVVKMLRFELQNDELFWETLRDYLAIYKDRSATTEDLKNVFEENFNKDLDYFFDQWVYGEGYPILKGSWRQIDDTLQININERTSMPGVTPFFTMKIEFKIIHENGDTIVTLYLDEAQKEFKLFMPTNTLIVNTDPNKELLFENQGIIQNSIAVEQKPTLKIYPNPFSDLLQIDKYGKSLITYEGIIYDIKGNQLVNFKTTENQYLINTSSLAPSIYYLKIITANQNYIYKIVKSR